MPSTVPSEWDAPWIFLQGSGWRTDLEFTCLKHKEFGTYIELSHNPGDGKCFFFKVTKTGDTPQNTPGNTPRHPHKVKIAREDGYVADWRFNAHSIIKRLEVGEGNPLPCTLKAGMWSFSTEDPILAARTAFDKFDADSSGCIDAAEMKVCAKTLGFVMSDEEIDTLIAEADKDGNGEVDFHEFCHILGIDSVKDNMKIVSSETSAELWLTREGFVWLSTQEKDEAVVGLKGKCPEHTVTKDKAWIALGKADEAKKRAEHWSFLEAKKEAEEQAIREAEAAVANEKERLRQEKEAKEERRRQREAGTYQGPDMLQKVKLPGQA